MYLLNNLMKYLYEILRLSRVRTPKFLLQTGFIAYFLLKLKSNSLSHIIIGTDKKIITYEEVLYSHDVIKTFQEC